MRSRNGLRSAVATMRRSRLRWLGLAVTSGLVLNGLRLRTRAEALTIVPPSLLDAEEAADATCTAHRVASVLGFEDVIELAAVDREQYTLLAADGVRVDPGVVRDATSYARRHGLEVLDLLPVSLDVERSLDVLRQVDPAAYASDRLAPGRGGNVAILVSEDALARAGGRPAGPIDAAALGRLLVELKRCAPSSTDVAVIEGVHAPPERAADRGRALAAVHGPSGAMAAVVPLATVVLLGLSLLLAPVWGVLAVIAFCAQPVLALRDSALRPRDGGWPLVARPVRTVARALGSRPPGPDAAAASDAEADDRRARLACRELLADGVERLFEPRAERCPLCGSNALTPIVRAHDELQGKPGVFVLDRCELCSHIFQNPRLTVSGLDFYYRDFYEGSGEEELEFVFASSDVPYRKRTHMVRRALGDDDPKTWLDVGAGHGHFCLLAREAFPETRFEGLDLSDGIIRAERRGWIERAHHGLFPDVAGDLVGRYDVISMFHYLEHTREPLLELDAARQALRPGGHLVIELPDPECRLGRWLGRWWGPWFQPQHQQLFSLGNLNSALLRRGFTTVAVERREAHEPVEAAFGVWLALNHLAPASGRPWQDETTPGTAARRAVVFGLGSPVLALALLADRLAHPVLRRVPGGPNAFRVIARRDGPGDENPNPHRS